MSSDWPDFNDIWDYDDPAATETRFRELLASAQTPDASYTLQLLTQIARTLGLQKKFDEAHVVLDEVESHMRGGDVVEARYLLERGRTLNSSRQAEQAVPLFRKAVDIAMQISADFYAVDALHMLGIAAPPKERLDWNLKAIEYAENSSQTRTKQWLGSLYNNTAWTLFDETRYTEALDLFEKAQAMREQQGQPKEFGIARWCVAKTLRMLGRVEEALAIQRELEKDGKSDGFTEEEIAECLHALGKHKEARLYFETAYARLSQIDWAAEDIQRMERIRSLSQ